MKLRGHLTGSSNAQNAINPKALERRFLKLDLFLRTLRGFHGRETLPFLNSSESWRLLLGSDAILLRLECMVSLGIFRMLPSQKELLRKIKIPTD